MYLNFLCSSGPPKNVSFPQTLLSTDPTFLGPTLILLGTSKAPDKDFDKLDLLAIFLKNWVCQFSFPVKLEFTLIYNGFWSTRTQVNSYPF